MLKKNYLGPGQYSQPHKAGLVQNGPQTGPPGSFGGPQGDPQQYGTPRYCF